MARKKSSKVDIIAAFVAKNPDVTWTKGADVLAKQGITPGYFASQRSVLKAAGEVQPAATDSQSTAGDASESQATEQPARRKPGRKTGPALGRKLGRKVGRKVGRKLSRQLARTSELNAATALTDLAEAAEFARKVGGLPTAQALLKELERVQI